MESNFVLGSWSHWTFGLFGIVGALAAHGCRKNWNDKIAKKKLSIFPHCS